MTSSSTRRGPRSRILLGSAAISAAHATVSLDAFRARSTKWDHLSASPRSTPPLAALPGVFLTGSAFRAIGIPDCIADASRDSGSSCSVPVSAPTDVT